MITRNRFMLQMCIFLTTTPNIAAILCCQGIARQLISLSLRQDQVDIPYALWCAHLAANFW